jgi:hypothetical protein
MKYKTNYKININYHYTCLKAERSPPQPPIATIILPLAVVDTHCVIADMMEMLTTRN